MDFEAVFQQMRLQYEDSLRGMALPPGVEEQVRARIAEGDHEGLVFMLKLAWVFGAQAGHAAAEGTKGAQAPTRSIQA